MKNTHLISGIITVIIFAITGQYMLHDLVLPDTAFDVQRMMYRASHIYLLWAGALNALLGCYWVKCEGQYFPFIQWAASAALILSQGFLLLAFMYEPAIIDQDRLLTKAGSLSLLFGLILTVAITLANGKIGSAVIERLKKYSH